MTSSTRTGERTRTKARDKEDGKLLEKRPHLANNLVQQEIVQLTENEEDGTEDVVPHGPDLIQDRKDDVGHQAKVQEGGAGRDSVSISVGHKEHEGQGGRTKREMCTDMVGKIKMSQTKGLTRQAIY
jgi:hypothetical protein